MKDILGQAYYDYYFRQHPGKLWIHNTYGQKEEMHVGTYFRQKDRMPRLELYALELCQGHVLDIGAGVGSHSLVLQEVLPVSALEISPLACAVMKQRGVNHIINTSIYDVEPANYNTLLMLMNGIGLTANLAGLEQFLLKASSLLQPAGQILFDSSDVSYLYDTLPTHHYYGEISYRYEYKKQKTDWFTWLYIDRKTMQQVAERCGWKMEVLFTDEYDQYLARLTRP